MSAHRIILVGPPGAGKGTQAERLCARLALAHLSTGDLLRAAVAAQSDLGRRAKGHMDAGELVPDELVCALVGSRLADSDARSGFLLDGFPRNVAQARALEAQLADSPVVDCVIHMQLDDDEIVRRLLARGRKDDSEPVIRNRLNVYADETEPLVAYYRKQGLIRTVDASGSIDEIEQRIADAVSSCGVGAS